MRLVQTLFALFSIVLTLGCENEIRTTATPEIAVEPSSLVFTAPEEGGDIRTITLMIRNDGDGPLLINSAQVIEDDDTTELYLQDAEDWSGEVRTVPPESSIPITVGWRVRDAVRDIGRLVISHNAGAVTEVPLQTVDIDPELSVRTEPMGTVMQAGLDVFVSDATDIAPQRVLIELGGQTVAPIMLEEVCLLAPGSGECADGNVILDAAADMAPADGDADGDAAPAAAAPEHRLFVLCEGNPTTVDACITPTTFGPVFFGETKSYSVFFRPVLGDTDARTARLQVTSNASTTPSYVVRVSGRGCVRTEERPVCGDCGDGMVTGYEQCDDGNLIDDDLCRNTCRRPSCGDSITSPPEECDDGNEINDDACTNDCRDAACGDGFLFAEQEACDDGNSDQTDDCLNDCTPARCGDGFLHAEVEICDDGNRTNGDGCDNNCTESACGNGVVGEDEECDDGNTVDGDGCDSNCMNTGCGNGVVTAGEECEYLGPGTEYCEYDEPACARCLANCTIGPGFLRYCGDNRHEPGEEECDDGNAVEDDECTSECRRATCGDNIVQRATELCDDGNTITEVCEYGVLPQECVVCQADCTRGPGLSPTYCGDGVRNGPEHCDDGNDNDADECPNDCIRRGCGNGIVDEGEECDFRDLEGGFNCDRNCTFKACGNGVVSEDANGQREECDDGNAVTEECPHGEGPCQVCTETCQRGAGIEIRCGDGILNGEEDCDDGNDIVGDSCLPGCVSARCGDGVVWDSVESCDDGVRLRDQCEYGPEACTVCSADCSQVRLDGRFCGDGRVTDDEECDPANPEDALECDDNCTRPACGNGHQGEDEECDDGNDVNGDTCDSNCTLPRCGNGIVTEGEQCDDGNAETEACEYGEAFCAVCNADCEIGLGIILTCGDRRIDGPEECDDGNDNLEDDCTEACRAARCGDGFVQAGVEGCDDANTYSEPCEYGEAACETCLENCQLGPGQTAVCGDGVRNGPEACDDGNEINDDECDNNCTIPGCGNGQLAGDEVCDDGDQLNGNGCDNNCTLSACGNGIVAGDEACDDGNALTEDCEYGLASCAVCDAQCRIANGRALFCGDARVDGPEECDDGNDNEDDACSSSCVLRRCGDGHIRPGVEECDDGNTDTEVCAYGQRACMVCQADCSIGPGAEVAFCGDGVVNGPEECDGGDQCTDECTLVPLRGDGRYGDPCECGVDCASGICLGAGRGAGHCTERCAINAQCRGSDLCRGIELGLENEGCADPLLGLGPDRVVDLCVPNETGTPCDGPGTCLFGSECIDQGQWAPDLTAHLVCAAACNVDRDCPSAYRCDALELDGRRMNLCQPRAQVRLCPDGTIDRCVDVCPAGPGEVLEDTTQCSSGEPGVGGYCTCACRTAEHCPEGFACALKRGEGEAPPKGTCVPMAGFACPSGPDGDAACPTNACHDPGVDEGLPLCTSVCADEAHCPDGFRCVVEEGREQGRCLP